MATSNKSSSKKNCNVIIIFVNNYCFNVKIFGDFLLLLSCSLDLIDIRRSFTKFINLIYFLLTLKLLPLSKMTMTTFYIVANCSCSEYLKQKMHNTCGLLDTIC